MAKHQIIVERDSLVKVAALVGLTIGEESSVMQVVRNIHVSVKNTRVTYQATNLTTSAELEGICTNTHGTNFAFLVPFVLMNDILKLLRGSDIIIDFDDEKTYIEIECGAYNGEVPVSEADEFPNLLTTFEDSPTTVPVSWLQSVHQSVAFAAAKDTVQGVLGGVLLRVEGREAVAAAIDGYRLAELRQDLDNDVAPLDVVIPAKSLKLLAEAIKQGWLTTSADLGLNENGGALIVQGASVSITIRVMDGDFPDYHRFWPSKTNNWSFEVDTDALSHAVNLAAVTVANDNKIVISLDQHGMLGSSCIVSSGSSSGKGTSKVSLDITVRGPDVDKNAKVGINSLYLKETFKASPDGKVDVSIWNEETGIVFKAGNWRSLSMPIKI